MDERDLLRESFHRLLGNDKALAGQLDKLKSLSADAELETPLKRVQERVGALEGLGEDSQLALETIVQRVGRPVLEVRDDDYVVDGPESAIWETRLSPATVRSALRQVIPSVGRVEVEHHPDLTWVGTAWTIADDILVTNRHVASEFAALSVTGNGRSFIFRRGFPDRNVRMTSRVDFRRELRNNNPRAFVVKEVLHIEDDDGPDFAFLRIERTGAAGPLSPALRPMTQAAEAQDFVATVGYPAADSRIPEAELMSRLFGDKYNVKRLAPGQVQRTSDDLIMHDCTTLGGNSGSPIVNLATGEVLGLHFSGVFLRENRGVPIQFVLSRLNKVLSPLKPTEDRPSTTPPDVAPSRLPPPPVASPPAVSPSIPVQANGHVVSLTIPLNISISIGAPITSLAPPTISGPAPAIPSPLPAPPTGPVTVESAVADVKARVQSRGDVLTVRDGYQFRNGWITPDQAVVVVMRDRGLSTPQELGLPSSVNGIPVEVRQASPWDMAEVQGKLEALEGVPRTSYKKPSDFQLEEVHEKMSVICHVSPDAGWPTLREFLEGTKNGLTIGMYDFTAPHIVEEVLTAVKDPPRKLTLVMQEGQALGGKPDDIPEETWLADYREKLDGRFDHAPASIGKDHQFASAYHIKVAVRDSKAFWLSSGNWQSSNQPNHGIAVGETSWDLLLGHNREWNIVIDNAKLAKQFEKYIQYDLKNAKADVATEAPPAAEALFLVDDAVEERAPSGRPTYHKPLVINRKVQVRPLLTPDNYQEHVLDLIKTAERRLLFQNQSLSLLAAEKNDDRFAELVDALLEKHKSGVDVRIIIRGEFAPVGPLEQLQKRGFDMSKVRLQNRCHTKGIIVDTARALVGSHNWTNQGTLVNRDASLIFEDEEIAEYFETVFWFDWQNLARQSVAARRARPATHNEAVPAGMRVVSWQEIVNGD